MRPIVVPITVGTIPFDDSNSVLGAPQDIVPSAPPIAMSMSYSVLPSAPSMSTFDPSAPDYPDDDTISIRTYTSTPPPFPEDDGKYCRIQSYEALHPSYVILHLFMCFHLKISICQHMTKPSR